MSTKTPSACTAARVEPFSAQLSIACLNRRGWYLTRLGHLPAMQGVERLAAFPCGSATPKLVLGARPLPPASQEGRAVTFGPELIRRLREWFSWSVPKGGYRPDIDGLRALAVVAVVAFHAFPGRLPGGFVGVDIFFVISGFLISTILVHEMETGTYRYSTFMARRIRRIFPALCTVLTATFIAGWLLLSQQELVALGDEIFGRLVLLRQHPLLAAAGLLRCRCRDEAAASPMESRRRGAVLHLLPADPLADLSPPKKASCHPQDALGRFARVRFAHDQKRTWIRVLHAAIEVLGTALRRPRCALGACARGRSSSRNGTSRDFGTPRPSSALR